MPPTKGSLTILRGLLESDFDFMTSQLLSPAKILKHNVRIEPPPEFMPYALAVGWIDWLHTIRSCYLDTNSFRSIDIAGN